MSGEAVRAERRPRRGAAFRGNGWRATGVAGLVSIAALPSVTAQQPGGPPAETVFSALQGDWEGSGTLLGRPASFTMRWDVIGDGFARLTFKNAWVGDDGGLSPVLSAHAIYFVRDSTAIGVWLDDRPQRLTIEAALTDSSVVASWTAASERGRTEYVVRSAGSVVVKDFVYSNGTEQLFGEASYRRRR